MRCWIKQLFFFLIIKQHGLLSFVFEVFVPFLFFLLVDWGQYSSGYSSTITSHSVMRLFSCSFILWSLSSTLTYCAITGGSHKNCMCAPRIDAWTDVTGNPQAALLKMSLSMPALTTAPVNRLSANEKSFLINSFQFRMHCLHVGVKLVYFFFF